MEGKVSRLYVTHGRKKEVNGCSGSKKRTHHEILPVRTREHISCGERLPGDVCNEIGHVHPGHYHQPHKGHNLEETCDSKWLSHSEEC